jgi:hypothetical protein
MRRRLLLLPTLLVLACSPTPTNRELPVTGSSGAANGSANATATEALRTTPPGDAAGRITGPAPLTVTMNLCRAESALAEDVTRYRYDFEGVGAFERGRCRESHVYTSPGTFRAVACVAGQPPLDEVCHTRTVRVEREREVTAPLPDHVLTLTSSEHCIHGNRIAELDFSVAFEPPIPAGQPYSVTVRTEGPSSDWLLFSQGQSGGWPSLEHTNIVIDGPLAGGDALPHHHVHRLTPSGPHQRLSLFAYTSYRTGVPSPPHLVATVTAFEMPGKRTAMVGPLVRRCP